MTSWRRLTFVIVALVLCAGCSAEDPQILTEEDLPAYTETEGPEDGIFASSWCNLGLAVVNNDLARLSGPPVGRVFTLKGSSAQVAAVILSPGGRYDSVSSMVDELESGYEKCLWMIEHEPDDSRGKWHIETVDGLPDGGFGYRLKDTNENALPTGEMVFAPTSDGRLAAVGVDYRGSEAPVDIAELLEKVLKRAPDFPAEDSD